MGLSNFYFDSKQVYIEAESLGEWRLKFTECCQCGDRSFIVFHCPPRTKRNLFANLKLISLIFPC